jgi:hypothetical protein
MTLNRRRGAVGDQRVIRLPMLPSKHPTNIALATLLTMNSQTWRKTGENMLHVSPSTDGATVKIALEPHGDSSATMPHVMESTISAGTADPSFQPAIRYRTVLITNAVVLRLTAESVRGPGPDVGRADNVSLGFARSVISKGRTVASWKPSAIAETRDDFTNDHTLSVARERCQSIGEVSPLWGPPLKAAQCFRRSGALTCPFCGRAKTTGPLLSQASAPRNRRPVHRSQASSLGRATELHPGVSGKLEERRQRPGAAID